ncbi:transglutaminase TgpA family protein [Endozoicomonas acroporae]|uniref:transglutaminase TgpA family protein n=1 Tax=Endozoicomonas acroporae TaxID=1701104 RepID=UPI003D793FF0
MDSLAVSRYATLWLLVAQVMVALPVLEVLPIAVLPLLVLTLMWRALIWFGRGSWPSDLLRRLLVAMSLVIIITSSGWQFSLELAVTFLVTGYALKMLEMKTRRDALVIAYIGFFVVGAGVIYSQSLMQALYQLLCLGVLVAAIHAMYSPASSASASFSIKGSLRFTGLILLQALPLTLALFIFVPRLGPLWAVPWPEGEAKTGLSDTMQPGDVARLSQSYELAFRAQFTGSVPPARERYWRTLVLDQYNGEQWWQSDLIRLLNQFPGEIDDERDWQGRLPVIDGWWQVQPGQYNYEVLLEPNGRQWLPVLGMAAVAVPETTVLRTLRLEADKPVFERRLYQPAQQSVVTQTITMPSWLLALNKSLPDNGNAQSRMLAQQLFAESGRDPVTMGRRVMDYFNQEPFYYTLSPPLMEQNEVDQFLFVHRRGFCEHYASSFVFMMRSVGIPARIVTGYLGGEYLPEEKVIRVLQRDAHAWAEIWVEGQGWIRFDPTAAVAPERIELGIDDMIEQGGWLQGQIPLAYRLGQTGFFKSVRQGWERLEYRWQKSVVQYQQEKQQSFMKELFGTSSFYWQQVGVLGALLALFLLLFGVFALFQRPALNPHQKLWLRLERKLVARGFERQAGEGPKDFALRVNAENDALGAQILSIVDLYIQSAYSGRVKVDKPLLDQLSKMIKQL